MHAYHLVFVHSSVPGTWVLATMRCTSWTWCVNIQCDGFPSGVYKGVVCPGQMEVVLLVSWGNATLIVIVIDLICILTSNVEGFLSLTSSSAFIDWLILDDSHSDWGGMESQCGFDLHFSDDWCWTLSHVDWPHRLPWRRVHFLCPLAGQVICFYDAKF